MLISKTYINMFISDTYPGYYFNHTIKQAVLGSEYMLVVPFKELNSRPVGCSGRNFQLGSLKWVIAPTILVVFAQARTNLQS